MLTADNCHQSELPAFRRDFTCPYFSDGRTASVEYVYDVDGASRVFHIFLSKGYRRIGDIFYRNVCEACTACIALRVKADAFISSRSQKRTLRKNRDVRVEVHPAGFPAREEIDLYRNYTATKHGGNDDPAETDTSLIMLHHGYEKILEMQYYLGDDLIGVGIVDEGEDSLSSNYFYYDTDLFDRRLGIFSILSEIELVKKLGKKYLYLGFYISDNPKMSYKSHFRPNEALASDTWVQFVR